MKGKPLRSRFRSGPAMSNLRDADEPEPGPEPEPEALPMASMVYYEPLPLLDPPQARRQSFPIFDGPSLPYPSLLQPQQLYIKADRPPAYQEFFQRPSVQLHPPSSSWSHPTFQFYYPSPAFSPPPLPPTTLSKEDYAMTLGRPPPPEEPFPSACSTPDPWREMKPEGRSQDENVQVKNEDSPLSDPCSPTSDDPDQDQGDEYVPSSPSTPGYDPRPPPKSYTQSRNYAPPPASFTATTLSPPVGDPPAVQGTGMKFSRGFSKGRPESLPLGMKYQCANCATTQTREWRRRKDQLLCNACGLYHAAHGKARPKDIQAAAAGRRANMAKNKKQPASPITPLKKPARARRNSKASPKSTLSPSSNVTSISPQSPLTLPLPASEPNLFTRRARMRSRAVDQLSMQSINEVTAGPASAPAQTMTWAMQPLSTLDRHSFKRRRTVDGSGGHSLTTSFTPLDTNYAALPSASIPTTPASAEGSGGWPNDISAQCSHAVTPHYFAQPDGTVTPYFVPNQQPYSIAPSPEVPDSHSYGASPVLPSWNELAYGNHSAHYMGWTPSHSGHS